ncbi:integrase [Brevibacillus laterosporus]|nr:integrase [Brevibacillus laterosporus]TPG89735.1 integrase [Brevibacillus laterosporus]
MLDRFVNDGLRAKSEATIKTYHHALQQFQSWLDGTGTSLEDYTRSDVQQYMDYLVAKKKSASTINKIYNAIKSFSRWNGKQEIVEDIRVMKQVDYKQQAPKALDRNEYNKLMREIERTGSKRDFAIVLTMLYTGLRVSELVNLDQSDVESSERKGELTVRTGKGNNERTIPLNAEVRRAINRYVEERSDSNDALFLSNRQQRISVRSVQHLLEQYGFHAHQLRHTFITALVRDNQDIGVIQSLSGHKSADMVLRYSKPTEEDRQRAVENLFIK